MKGSNIRMIIQFVNQQTKYPVKEWRRLFEQVAHAALDLMPAGREIEKSGFEPGVVFVFAGPQVMRRVNRETRQVDRLTDVLSFPLLEMKEGRLAAPLAAQDLDRSRKDGRIVVPLGEIMISLDRAFAQADEYGHSKEREAAFLAAHGLLHLLGYDHQTPAQERKTRLWQSRILDHLHLGRNDSRQGRISS
jgi:rRNA maturation RNase YbeY